MSINEMSLTEVEARLAEISKEIETRSGEELEQAKAEVIELEARKAELKELEQRKADAEALAKGEVEPAKIIEERDEDLKMEKREFTVDSVEYRNAWLKQQMGVALDAEERAAMATVDVVPTITENKIINRLKENALLSQIDFTTFKGYVNIPNYTTNGDAAWDTTNEQKDFIDHVSLSLYQLIKTIEVPGKFDATAIDAFEAYIVEALTNKIEAALQAAVIVGTGSSQPTGINVTHSTADGTFTKAAITKADLMKIMGSLSAEYQKDAVWIMPNKVFYEAMAVCDLPGFVALNAELKPIIGGKPVVIDDNCIISSKDTVFYGASKAYHMNLGAPIEVARDTSVGFKSNAVNYRAVALADGKLDNAAAFVKYTRATA